MAEPYRVLPLDAIEPVPIPGALAWRPVRATLGVRAFGGDPVFVPAAHEWIWRCAVADEIGRARSVVDDAPDNAGVPYARALITAADEDADGARTWLARAVEREPALRDEARGEELLAAVARELT
jgi:hypothetical protein